MEWRDEGIVIGVKRHGEGAALLELMTREHGRHLGLVRGGRSARMQPVLQAGNSVAVAWRARLDEHLGSFQVEPTAQRAARLMGSPAALYGLGVLGALVRLLPERDPHPGLYEGLEVIVNALDDPALAGPLVVRFELAILQELGFGLDLAQCAATGVRDNLAYVSPKTGRAVSAEAGGPWRDKLLPLPAFLHEGQGRQLPGPDQLAAAFRLTGHFLNRHVYEPRGVPAPEVRAAFLAALLAAAQR
ncbi:DNA repair protein RecO [Alsobacter soli]|uniref:DNA repair protein RecO n=1 Tax=Alsobacter soli TaxID=2109933 RepID=A0A2T1HNL5_9HYPH|nr:DNA repair protein RecO [Alsobacter soli]PSC03235.1 DNA repair protein RecO [Alsobacter soli]